jgi:adenosylcobinamide-GDP ribazoletransferase
MKSFLLALQFLTIVRIQKNADYLSGHFLSSLRWFFLIGLLIGAVQWIFCWIALKFYFPFDVLAPLLVIIGIVTSGGLHLDGVADTADGFGAGNDRESVLRIMKDDRTGVFGIAAIFLTLYLKILAFTHAAKWESLDVVLIAPMLSRGLVAVTCTIFPYARAVGTGKAFAGGSFFKHALLPLLFCGMTAAYFLKAKGLYLFGIAIFITFLFDFYCYGRIRGFTGDTLGAQIEFCEIITLFAGGLLL